MSKSKKSSAHKKPQKKQPQKKNKTRTGLLIALAVALVLLIILIVLVSGQYTRGRSGIHHVEIDIEGYGTIKLELDGNTAPITVGHFLELAESGFYEGVSFHRIINGFMMQGGDPDGDGLGTSQETIVGEFAVNGIPNDIDHVRGVISMARAYDPNSATSQFFIVHQDSPHLNGKYAAFGHVTEGIEIVDQICENTPVLDRNGTVAPENRPIISEVRVID